MFFKICKVLFIIDILIFMSFYYRKFKWNLSIKADLYSDYYFYTINISKYYY